MTRIQRVCSGVDRSEPVEPDVGRLEVPGGSPRRLGWGLTSGHGLNPTLLWYGTDRDHVLRQGQPQIPHGHRRDETPPELGPVDSTISGSPDEPAALDATGSMTNDLRCCDDSKTMLEGSRGGSASLPTHSTSPFQSPRGRMSVASSHVPHPRPCGPRSCWDRCTILHIRGAAGPQRRPSHRSAPPKRCTMSIMKRRGHSIEVYPGGASSHCDISLRWCSNLSPEAS